MASASDKCSNGKTAKTTFRIRQDLERLVMDPDTEEIQPIAEREGRVFKFRVWNWSGLMTREGYTTTEQSWVRNLRTNYRWKMTCICPKLFGHDGCRCSSVVAGTWEHDELHAGCTSSGDPIRRISDIRPSARQKETDNERQQGPTRRRRPKKGKSKKHGRRESGSDRDEEENPREPKVRRTPHALDVTAPPIGVVGPLNDGVGFHRQPIVVTPPPRMGGVSEWAALIADLPPMTVNEFEQAFDASDASTGMLSHQASPTMISPSEHLMVEQYLLSANVDPTQQFRTDDFLRSPDDEVFMA